MRHDYLINIIELGAIVAFFIAIIFSCYLKAAFIP